MEKIDLSGIPQQPDNRFKDSPYRTAIRDAIVRLGEQEFTAYQLRTAMAVLPEYSKETKHPNFRRIVADCIRDMVKAGTLECVTRETIKSGRAGIYRNPRKDSSDTL